STASASWPRWWAASRRSPRSCRRSANRSQSTPVAIPHAGGGRRGPPPVEIRVMLADVLQLFIAGLATGGIYALAAIGFTLLWQTSQTINFAQGEFVMLPAFFVLIGMGFFGLPFWAALLIGVAASIVTLGLMFKKLMVDPMLNHGVLPLVIATIGLAILMKEAVREFYGADAWPFPPLAAATNVTVFGAALAVQSLVVLGISIA